ncbi:MAG TPA: glycosyltransferase family 39 protein, partial [Ramlibacter sp.]|nr:glycosyltransferase family 39 protein [Ramlibacter sp.]
MNQPEPSVLDYVKSLLPWSRSAVSIPLPELEAAAAEPVAAGEMAHAQSVAVPWRSLLALSLALLAQLFFEPPHTAAPLGVAFYVLAFGLLGWAILRDEWGLAPLPETLPRGDPLSVRWLPFLVSALLLVPVFILLGGQRISPGLRLPDGLAGLLNLHDDLYTWYNFVPWIGTLGLFCWSLWLRQPAGPSLWSRLGSFLQERRWLTGWTLLAVAAVAAVLFFRIYHIAQTPAEPFSDHAEKILDVYDISQGQTRIFFPRNTGREDFQMYWTLLMSWVFGTGLTFLTLKIGTVGLGLLSLPFIYLLGKEVGGRRVGLLAFFLAGIAYWPNTISRIGLRFPLYPMFVAPLMYFLVRGLRTRSRNDFILAGLALGLGLHGYSPFRVVPLLVVAAFVLYLLHAQSKGARQDAVLWLVIVGLVSLFVFLPLLRYATANPDMFSYRAATRMGSIEQALPSPWWQILLQNTWNSLRMLNWNDGVIWVHSVPDRPALDVVTAALFLIGVALLVVRYLRQRNWLDLFILISIPLLMLPSILSLAFPDENPSLNRTSGAVIPVFLVIALAFDGFIRSMTAGNRRRVWAYALTAVLLLWTSSQNFDLEFHQFDQQFRNNAWNTTDMGKLIQQFRASYGETDTVWIVP